MLCATSTERMDNPEHDASELLHELAAQASAVENMVAQSQYGLWLRAPTTVLLSADQSCANADCLAYSRFTRIYGASPSPAMETSTLVFTGRQDRITARIKRTSALRVLASNPA